MNVILIQLLVGFVLVGAALLWLLWRLRDGDHQHHERLWLLPLDDDAAEPERPTSPDRHDCDHASDARNEFAPARQADDSSRNGH